MSDNVVIQLCRGWLPFQTITAHNIITTKGLEAARDCIGQNNPLATRGAYAPSHIALGTGTTAAQVTDTALQLYVPDSHVIIHNRSSADFKCRFQGHWDTGDANGNTYTEAALYDGPLPSDNLLARVVFAGVAKTSSIQLIISWDILLTSV